MALFFEGMACGLCKKAMSRDQQLFGTWGVWLPQSDPLARFCDSMIHWDCYAQLPERSRFAKSYFDFWIEFEKSNPYWWKAFESEDVFVTVNPDSTIGSVWVYLAETGSRHNIELADWEAWLNQTPGSEHPVETEALIRAARVLKVAIPSPDHLIAAIDWNSKRALFDQLELDKRKREIERAVTKQRIDQHNLACERLMNLIEASGAECPQCGTQSRNFRLSARHECRSLIICCQCGGVIDVTQHD